MLTSPCLSWPTTLIPDGSSRPCPSGPKGTTPPHTSGPNFQVVLIQVTPKIHVDPLHVALIINMLPIFFYLIRDVVSFSTQCPLCAIIIFYGIFKSYLTNLNVFLLAFNILFAYVLWFYFLNSISYKSVPLLFF